jgi:hypothetical protein
MTAKKLDPDDPMALVGVAVPADADALDEMARCLVEEYLREGWAEERLLALFRNPFYRTPHLIYRARGEEYVRHLIEQVGARWGVWQMAVKEREASGDA